MVLKHLKFLAVWFGVLAALSSSLPADDRTEQIDLEGLQLFLHTPADPAPGKPWIWVAEFPGQHETFEKAMLARGWHVAYVRVPNKFGSPWAMERWETAYKELHKKRGLAAKPTIWAFSRGGLYALSWLRRHPDRANLLVLDNAVTDVRSWPAGQQLRQKGVGDAAEWRRYVKHLRFADETAALAESPQPTHDMKAAIQTGVVLISCYGTADGVVPHDDNGQLLVDFWRKHGGEVHVFPNEGGQHAPTGIVDPQPIIDLLTAKHAGR